MPRLNSGLEVLKELKTLGISAFDIQPTTPGDTITTAPVTAGATTVAVTAITNFSAADPVFLIGDGGVELLKIGTPNVTMPVTQNAAIAQSTGARMVEAVERVLGHIESAGVEIGGSYSLSPVNSAVWRTPITYLPSGPAELSVAFSLYGVNTENFLRAFAATETLLGTGTSQDPYRALIDGTTIGSQGTQCIRVLGTRQDLKTVQVDFLNPIAEVAVQGAMGGASPFALRMQLKPTAFIVRIW